MKKIVLAAALFSAAFATAAHAATATTTLTVSATIAPTCTASAVSAAFGTIDRTEKSVSTLIKLTCGSALSAVPTVNFGAGRNLASGIRYMNGGTISTARLRYDLLNGTTLLDTVANTPLSASGTDYTLTLTTRIPADANAVADAYSDAVTITFTY
jgi:spore coat protein U-like protein